MSVPVKDRPCSAVSKKEPNPSSGLIAQCTGDIPRTKNVYESWFLVGSDETIESISKYNQSDRGLLFL